jgi:hypothetical protein
MADAIVISSLKAKRAELDGELMETEKRAIRIRADLEAIDRALKVFDPDIRLSAIRPVVRRAAPKFFAHGQFARAAMDVLRRAEGPLTYREIAERMNVEHKLNAGGLHLMRDLVKKVRSAFGHERPGIRKQTQNGEIVVWVE